MDIEHSDLRADAHYYIMRAFATYEGMLHAAYPTLKDMASSSAYKALTDAYNAIADEYRQTTLKTQG